MFRGFRWQLTLFLLAAVLFAGSAAIRLSRIDQPTPTQPAPTATIPSTVPSALPATAVPVTSQGASRHVDRYREGLAGTAQRINPLFAHLNPVDRDIASLIFESLFVINEYGEAVPQLAEEVVISSDGLDYVIRLRGDAHWQDGIPLTAADVVFTLDLMSDPDYSQFSATADFWRALEVRQLGDFLLRIRLAQPLGSLPHLLTFGILPEHALRGSSIANMARHAFNLSPIGSGAYQLAHLSTTEGRIDAVQLALSPVYQQRASEPDGSAFKEIVFHQYPDSGAALAAWAAGEVDALANVAPREQLSQLPNARIYTQVQSSLAVLIFNWDERPFAERRVRQALSLSLDAPRLVTQTFGTAAAPADSPYPPSLSAYLPNESWSRYDPAQARALLDAAQVAPPSQPYIFLVDESPYHVALARAVAAQWAQLGLTFAVDSVDASQFHQRLDEGRFDAAIVMQRIGGNPDLFRYWHSSQHDAGANYGLVSDYTLDEPLQAARGEIYGRRRQGLYQAFQAAFAEQVAGIPLYYPLYTVAMRQGVEGMQLGYLASPADRFRGIGRWRSAPLNS